MKRTFLLPVIALAFLLLACACGGNSAPAAPSGGETQMFTIEVTDAGFVPNKLQAVAGRPIMLMVTRKTDKTCATEIVIKEYGINQKLPLNQEVNVTFTPTKPGKIRFACGMDMIAGEIEVK